MEERRAFLKRVRSVLEEIGPEVLSYNKDEFWTIQNLYEYVEFYVVEHRLFNATLALVLGRGLHNGTYRKSKLVKDGVEYRMPYYVHPLAVCRMLIDLRAPLSHEEEDILLAAALCHDMVEDVDFAEGGRELCTRFHLDPRVYEAVCKVSKRYDFTEEEEKEFFHEIEMNKYALLIKLSDRGNNVEDLYNRSVWKVHEYIGETRRFFLPMCTHGKEYFPELEGAIELLEDKMTALTEAAEILVDRYDQHEQGLREQLSALQMENNRLRAIWEQMWKQEGGI